MSDDDHNIEPLTDAPEDAGEFPADLDRDWLEDVEHALRDEDDGTALDLVAGHTPADVANLLINLPLRRARTLFALLPNEAAAEVLTGISEELRAALIQDSSIERIAAVADSLEQDDAVDLLLDLPEESLEPVLAVMESPEELRVRLDFEEDTAGGIMSNKFVAVLDDWDVGTATRMIRRKASEIQKLYEIYVVDEDRKLCGRLKLRDLLLNDRETPVSSIMQKRPASVGSDTDQEEVLDLALRLNLQTVPVVDEDNRVIGRITVDELAEIIRDEAEEDMMIMGGVAPDALPDDSVGRIIRGRLPWLIGGLVGASLAGLVVGGFEDKINQAAILASFIPVVMAMAGNAGIQASTVTVQGLAAGNVWLGDVGSRLGKEFLGSLINGALVAVALGGLVILASQFVDLQSPGRLALAAGLSVATVTVMAATLGATIPLVLKRFGIDPAVASGVFITTANDIFGVIVYFLIASTIYLANSSVV
jgi:magnesium transporter